MPKLNQILAIEKTKKTKLHNEITAYHHALQKPALVNGHHKAFTPREDDGETFPDDDHHVQHQYGAVVNDLMRAMVDLFDVTATKDFANCDAKADVKVDGTTLITKAPVPFLLFLEKELHNLHTFVDKMVELDPAEIWDEDANSGLFRSKPVVTHKTKKVQKPLVLYPATDKHPAQTQIVTDDMVVGHWTTTKFSGAIPRPVKRLWLERISKLEDAVKFAREQANSIDVANIAVGEKVLSYVFGVV